MLQPLPLANRTLLEPVIHEPHQTTTLLAYARAFLPCVPSRPVPSRRFPNPDANRGASGSYRIDGVGLVGNSSGRFFLDDLQENQWTAYSVMTEAAEYTVTLEVTTVVRGTISSTYCTTVGVSNCSAWYLLVTPTVPQ